MDFGLSYVYIPPSFDGISPSTIVVLKNLMKKDETTKEKALMTLQKHLVQPCDVLPILDAWCTLYTRLCIDTSKKVRSISHIINGTLISRAKKQSLPYLKRTIPHWLAGSYDTDKTVARSARSSLEQAFSSEKIQKLWLAYAQEISDYCIDVLTIESPESLSDPRIVSKDDSLYKFVLVSAEAMSLLTYLLSCLPTKSIPIATTALQTCLQSDKFWALSSYIDHGILRSVLPFLTYVAENYTELLSLHTSDMIKMLRKCLSSESSAAYAPYLIRFLTVVSYKTPDIWHANEENPKKSLSPRLFLFLSKIPGIDDPLRRCIIDLISKLPQSCLSTDNYTKIISEDFYFDNLSTPISWKLLFVIISCVANTDPDSLNNFAKFLASKLSKNLSKLSVKEARNVAAELNVFWNSQPNLAQRTSELLLDEIENESRFNNLAFFLAVVSQQHPELQFPLDNKLMGMITEGSISTTAIAIVSGNEQLYEDHKELFRQKANQSLNSDTPDLKLLKSIVILDHDPEYRLNLVQESFSKLRSDPSYLSSFSELTSLFSSITLDIDQLDLYPTLLHIVDTLDVSKLSEAANSLVSIDKKFLDQDSILNLLLRIYTRCSDEGALYTVFADIMDNVITTDPLLAKKVLISKTASPFTSYIWDISSETASSRSIQTISDFVTSQLNRSDKPIDLPLLTSLGNQIKTDILSFKPFDNSMDRIFSLLDTIKDGSISPKQQFDALSFTPSDWDSAWSDIDTFLVPPSTVLSSSLGSALYLCEPKEHSTKWTDGKLLLIAMYTTSVMSFAYFDNNVTLDDVLVSQLLVLLEFVSDILNSGAVTALSTSAMSHQEWTTNILQFVTYVQNTITPLVSEGVLEYLLQHSDSNSTTSYYFNRAYAANISIKAVNWTESEASEFYETHEISSTNFLRSVSLAKIISALSLVPESIKMHRNKIAERFLRVSTDNLQEYIFTSTCLAFLVSTNETSQLFAQNRYLMIIEHALKADELDVDDIKARVASSYLLCSLLKEDYIPSKTFHAIADYISDSITLCAEMQSLDLIPLAWCSFRIYRILARIAKQHKDLSDIWEEINESVSSDILDIFYKSPSSAEFSVDTEIRDQLLSQLVLEMAPKVDLDMAMIYPILGLDSWPLQRAALVLLHDQIVRDREAMAIEAALQSDQSVNAELPVELVSFVTQVPQTRGSGNEPSHEEISYVGAFHLIFDHFESTTYKVRSDLMNSLKGTGYIAGMLDYVVSRLNIQNSTKDLPLVNSIVDELDIQDGFIGSIMRMYYECLLYCPSEAKYWWRELSNRQLRDAVLTFTEKFFSDSILDAEYAKIRQASSEFSAGQISMKVKMLKAVREVLAEFNIDEQNMEIKVTIPGAYPLQEMTISGSKRLAVKEKQWRAWILASQSIVNTQNSSISDSLILFKRNISLHFEGVEECAICYMVLQQDLSLPTKRCVTCKHKFHAICLYKWFKSSNNSSCPLCRSAFSFSA
ncbi:hypothetical protein CANCADRAFT_30909 [Tortispora caseinolytica NRRL Y-17796]|uniref:E3 ubiquitin-protein ligase listerin n=1 Tax=Tortispora caseinolytica NRRL Y-17796 TaxID=767744 RepID=A0A1E4TMB8_9ASCO|nr:hypothetical protein CANCADRAFT_30909 [Tortispora caseinolytica NRRL Y-17796]